MKFFEVNLNHKEGYSPPQTSLLYFGVNPEDNNALHFVFSSPFVETREYIDPTDFIKKSGPTRIRQKVMLRKLRCGKRHLISTGPIIAPLE